MEDLIKELLNNIMTTQEQDKKKFLICFGVLAGLFVISIIANILTQCLVNKQLLKNETKKIKIERKLSVIEDLYKSLINLKSETFSFPISNAFPLEVKKMNIWLSENRINLTADLYNCSQDILDYFLEIYTNYERKDINKEKKLFQRFLSGYEKI